MKHIGQSLTPGKTKQNKCYAGKEKKTKQMKNIKQSLTPGKTKCYARKGSPVKSLNIVTL